MAAPAADQTLIQQIRSGDEFAWQECISRYEGRLQAFVVSRLKDQVLAEDLVQDVFVAFLTSLPNYDASKPIEAFLFTITAHKITDVLRKTGRRPTLHTLSASSPDSKDRQLAARQRMVSSLARSHEQQLQEEKLVAECLKPLIQQWLSQGEIERLQCSELLFVKGLTNKQVAEKLQISEQAVSNHKRFFISKLQEAARKESRSLTVLSTSQLIND